jgi:hypothetical protein
MAIKFSATKTNGVRETFTGVELLAAIDEYCCDSLDGEAGRLGPIGRVAGDV